MLANDSSCIPRVLPMSGDPRVLEALKLFSEKTVLAGRNKKLLWQAGMKFVKAESRIAWTRSSDIDVTMLYEGSNIRESKVQRGEQGIHAVVVPFCPIQMRTFL